MIEYGRHGAFCTATVRTLGVNYPIFVFVPQVYSQEDFLQSRTSQRRFCFCKILNLNDRIHLGRIIKILLVYLIPLNFYGIFENGIPRDNGMTSIFRARAVFQRLRLVVRQTGSARSLDTFYRIFKYFSKSIPWRLSPIWVWRNYFTRPPVYRLKTLRLPVLYIPHTYTSKTKTKL